MLGWTWGELKGFGRAAQCAVEGCWRACAEVASCIRAGCRAVFALAGSCPAAVNPATFPGHALTPSPSLPLVPCCRRYWDGRMRLQRGRGRAAAVRLRRCGAGCRSRQGTAPRHGRACGWGVSVARPPTLASGPYVLVPALTHLSHRSLLPFIGAAHLHPRPSTHPQSTHRSYYLFSVNHRNALQAGGSEVRGVVRHAAWHSAAQHNAVQHSAAPPPPPCPGLCRFSDSCTYRWEGPPGCAALSSCTHAEPPPPSSQLPQNFFLHVTRNGGEHWEAPFTRFRCAGDQGPFAHSFGSFAAARMRAEMRRTRALGCWVGTVAIAWPDLCRTATASRLDACMHLGSAASSCGGSTIARLTTPAPSSRRPPGTAARVQAASGGAPQGLTPPISTRWWCTQTILNSCMEEQPTSKGQSARTVGR